MTISGKGMIPFPKTSDMILKNLILRIIVLVSNRLCLEIHKGIYQMGKKKKKKHTL